MSSSILDICHYIENNFYNYFEIDIGYTCMRYNITRKIKSHVVFDYKLFIINNGQKLCVYKRTYIYILGIIGSSDFDDLRSKLANGDEISLNDRLNRYQDFNIFKYHNEILTEYCKITGGIIGQYPLPENTLLEMIDALENN